MMKYINPEIKINMFELESVATEASTVVPSGDGVVSGLEGIDAANIRQVNMNEFEFTVGCVTSSLPLIINFIIYTMLHA